MDQQTARTCFRWRSPSVDLPNLVWGLKIWWLAGWEVKEGQTSSACWLCRLGFKVGQLMPGSSRAKWTSLVAVWGGVLEEPPGSRGCQGNVKHSKCGRKETRLVWFTNGPVCSAESFIFCLANDLWFQFRLTVQGTKLYVSTASNNISWTTEKDFSD